MNTAPAFAYDDVFYPARPLPQTHPDRLATQARIFGMNPAPVARCRVLELGCGDGGNLIPMAMAFPESRFVGIDLAEKAVTTAVEAAAALGVENVAFQRQDIMEAGKDLGQFDYVIAHGVYSWVPPAVRDRILAIAAETLTPHGVAYVSYNTYPGCHLRHTVREMMRFHIRDVMDSREKMARARHLVEFLIQAHAGPSKEQAFMREELAQVQMHGDSSLFHDDLADINVPVYFREFVAHAARHRLQYLGEANVFQMHDRMYEPAVRETLHALTGDDVILKEQYLDFMSDRRFRQTLLCRDDVVLDRTPPPAIARQFHLASQAKPVSPHPDVTSSSVVEQFRGMKGAAMATDHPLAKTAILLLGQRWPELLSFDELFQAARRRLADAPGVGAAGHDADALAEIMLATYYAGLVEFHSHPPRFCVEPGPRPVASPLVRFQVQSDSVVTNLRHTTVDIEDTMGRHLIGLLDGTRDRKELLAEMRRFAGVKAAGGEVKIEPEGLDKKLRELGRLALLVA
ncbi:MAG TPA: class I SAM-dependent methyltransferase [Methylomirabilota bacterium]|jgi:methyltransferase-like protein/protein-L-isoaspartate O-methyltransferase